MSTKCTVAYADNWHLFQEAFEDGTILYLEIDIPRDIGIQHARIAIPAAVVRGICEQAPARMKNLGIWDKAE